MRQGTYIRNVTGLKGERALIRDNPLSEGRTVLAQFDNLNLVLHGEHLANGWHEFLAECFEIDPPEYVLSYELRDDPGTEHVLGCNTAEEARNYLQSRAGLVAWAELEPWDNAGDLL